MAQVALAWVLARPGLSFIVSSVAPSEFEGHTLTWLPFALGVTAPIVGTTSLENLHDLLGKFFTCSPFVTESPRKVVRYST